jgi:hypothetical protein
MFSLSGANTSGTGSNAKIRALGQTAPANSENIPMLAPTSKTTAFSRRTMPPAR